MAIKYFKHEPLGLFTFCMEAAILGHVTCDLSCDLYWGHHASWPTLLSSQNGGFGNYSRQNTRKHFQAVWNTKILTVP